MKKIIAIAMVLVMALFALTSCGQSDIQSIKDSGKIVVGVTVYEPMDYIDADGNWAGFDAELANMFAESLGIKAQLVIIDWNNKVAELDSYQIDLVWNGMTASEELGKNIDFSVSYAKNAQVAVVKKGSSVTKENLVNATIAVENGSAGETVARETIGANKIVEKSNGQAEALTEIIAGTAEAAVIDITMAQSVLGKGVYADLEILAGASYGDEIFAVGLRKGSDIKEELDAFLKAKYADGTLAALAEKYDVGLNTEALAG